MRRVMRGEVIFDEDGADDREAGLSIKSFYDRSRVRSYGDPAPHLVRDQAALPGVKEM
jgi:hypothetical protein